MSTASRVKITGRRENDTGTHLDLVFSNGSQRTFHLKPDSPLYDDFAVHGLGKKIRDQIAITKTTEDAIKAVDALFEAFHAGKWNLQRNGEGAPAGGILAHALAAISGKTLEQAQAYVAKLSKKQQADLRKHPPVAAKIVELTASGPKADAANDLLNGFTAGSSDEK